MVKGLTTFEFIMMKRKEDALKEEQLSKLDTNQKEYNNTKEVIQENRFPTEAQMN